MAKVLKVDRNQIINLVSEFRSCYKKRSYVTVKECPPAKIYDRVGIPVGGLIAKHFIDFLLKKDYMTQLGKRVISYRWCDQLHDAESIADRFIQHINSVTAQVKEVPNVDIVDPAEFQLGDKVFVITGHEVYEGLVVKKTQSWSASSGASEVIYSIDLPNRVDHSGNVALLTDVAAKRLSRTVDGLLLKLKESVNYIKHHV